MLRGGCRLGLGFGLGLVVLAVVGTTLPTAASAGVADRAPGSPTQLTVDDDPHPLGVEGAPQFGWVVRDRDRSEVQTGYELRVFARAVGRGADRPVWSSGRVRSTEQASVGAPGLVLHAGAAYSWTVRTWDRAGRVGPFAPRATFEVGLADGDWHADWIRRVGDTSQVNEDYALLRRSIAVTSSPVTRARIYAGAGQQFDLRVNGVRVAHGPSYAYPDESYYQVTDLTRAVRAGRPNVVAAIAHWSTPGQGRPASVPGFIARVVIEHADGSVQTTVTDARWRGHAGPWLPSTLRNDEGDYVESIDARRLPTGWDAPGFDDRAWSPAVVLGAHPTAPFSHLVAARTHIVEHPVRPVRLTRPDGAVVVDLGTVQAATPVVRFRHGRAGRAVKIVAGYLLDPNGHVSTTRGVQDTDMHFDYVERDGVQEFHPFGYLGFRYLEVDGAGERLTAADVGARNRHAWFPDENAASFHTSNPAIDAVWRLARHSSLNASQEQFVDTPTREKGAFQDPFDSPVVMAAFGDRALTAQALRDVARSQARYWPDGRVNVVYPNGDGARDIPDATEQYVGWVWQTYLTTGDRTQLAALYPVVRNIADYVARAIDPVTGLVTYLPGGGDDYLHGLVDWPPQMRYGYDVGTAARTTENILAVDVFRRVGAMAAVLGRAAGEVALQADRTRALTAAIDTRLRRPDGVFVDGLEADGSPSAHASQLANAYAVAYGVATDRLPTIAQALVAAKNRMGVSTFSTLLTALHATGHDDALVAAITDPRRPGYARILHEGGTYIWESWDARRTGDSESHAWGSPVLNVLQDDVLGVRVDRPGAAHVAIALPHLTLRAAGRVATQRGPIPIAWSRTRRGDVRLAVTIPANVTASVALPARDVRGVRESGRRLAHDPGVTRVGAHHGRVVVHLGSGRYGFAVSGDAASGQ
ncbi:MAG: family 78 glycoside hydrolase catalytic domain [Acidimicrobiia bacterium]